MEPLGIIVGVLIVLLNLGIIALWLAPYDDPFRHGGPGSPVRSE